MLNYRAKSNIVLGFIALLSLFAFIAVENSKKEVREEWYTEKLAAARLSQQAALCLKDNRLEAGVFIEEVNDPNQTSLIGQEYTQITTDRGYIDAKLSSLNPNLAAVVVQYLKDAGLEENDHVAIAFTGSFPALNISVIAAVEVLKLRPIIISSVGSSNYGANDPFFTWLDMESVLFSSGVLHHKSVAASIGGGFDEGRGLSPEGRALIVDAINRNNVSLIREDHLNASIEKRMQIYRNEGKGKPVKAYINVGGGIASLGHSVNASLIPTGLNIDIPAVNYPVRGVIVQMGQKKIPVIQLVNIKEILSRFGLPNSPVPLPEPGNGGIFVSMKYNLVVTSVATFILMLVIVLIYIAEKKAHRLGSDVVHGTFNPSSENKDNDGIMDL
ncbi:MAG: poly-gamma-glutamate system protein [Bacteroidales bacterium]|nr:poly-gamma-glutamate system protein [Bacteroidales bacterium]MBK9356422.1 poly-gamma-glutamate system protein [Bacteroidales bacterium]